MQAQEGRRLEEDRCAADSTGGKKQRPEAAKESVQSSEIRCALPGTGEDEELVFEQKVLGQDGLEATRSEESSQCRQQMGKEHEKDLHSRPG